MAVTVKGIVASLQLIILLGAIVIGAGTLLVGALETDRSLPNEGKAVPRAIDIPDAALSPDGKSNWIVRSELPIGSKGSLMLWFEVDTTVGNGPDAKQLEEMLIEAPGLFKVTLNNTRQHTTINWKWESVSERINQNLSLALPGLPGPGWVHLSGRWSASEGVFDVFLNGVPARLPGTVLPPWPTGQADHIRFPVDGMTKNVPYVSDSWFSISELQQAVSAFHGNIIDTIPSLLPRGQLAFDVTGAVNLFDLPLRDAHEVSDWVMEGPGQVNFQDGWMQLKSQEAQGRAHFVFWMPDDLPANFAAEWDFQLVDPDGLCIVFFAARGRNGEDLFDTSLRPRDGIFSRYHSSDINSYHVSYYANNPGGEPGRVTMNLRKNHGFYLLDNGPSLIPVGSERIHRIQLVKIDGWIRLAVDGDIALDFQDDGKTYGPTLKSGKLGFRQMQSTVARYKNLRIFEVSLPETRPELSDSSVQ